jgi:hypothetical protein
MFAQLVSTYHLHQIVNHFIIALLNLRDRRGNLLPPRRSRFLAAGRLSHPFGQR